MNGATNYRRDSSDCVFLRVKEEGSEDCLALWNADAQSGNAFVGNLHAEVATGNHDRETNNVIDLLERGRLFYLHHDPGAITDQPAGLDDVSGLLNERQRLPIDPQLQAECEIGAIFRRQR